MTTERMYEGARENPPARRGPRTPGAARLGAAGDRRSAAAAPGHAARAGGLRDHRRGTGRAIGGGRTRAVAAVHAGLRQPGGAVVVVAGELELPGLSRRN